MRFISLVTILPTLLFTVRASEGSLAWMSFAYCEANTEIKVSSKTAYVTYPGLSDATSDSEVTLNIYRDQFSNPEHTFIVPKQEHANPNIFRFALEQAEEGKYSAQLCFKKTANSDPSCSYKSLPASPIETGTFQGNPHQISCLRHLDDTREESLTAPLMPIERYVNSQELNQLKSRSNTVAAKNHITQNKQIKTIEGKRKIYFAVAYAAKHFRAFMRKEDICSRLYRPVIITYLINKEDRRVVKSGRISPTMPVALYEKYLGIDISAKKDQYGQYPYTSVEEEKLPLVPVEFFVDIDDDTQGAFEVWHTACVVKKDGVEQGIVHCANPFNEEINIPSV